MIYIVNKKIIQILFVIITIFTYTNTTIGENTNKEQNSGYIQKIVPFPEINEERNQINYIDTKFCNNGLEENKLIQTLSITIRPGEEKEICIIHFNTNKKDIYLWGAFPDNAIEANGNTNCSTNYERTNPFSKFIKPFKENFVKVPADGYVIRKTTIKFPVGINGIQKGCFAYGVDQGELKKGETLLFVIRKINHINISIEGKEYTKIEVLKDSIIKNRQGIFIILFIGVFVLLVLEIRKYNK